MDHSHLSTVETHVQFEITHFYLPPDRGDVPTITQPHTRFVNPGEMDARLSWPEHVRANILLEDITQ